MTAQAFLVYEWPDGGWVIATDERSIALRYDTREEAEAMARILADKYGGYLKAATPLMMEEAEQKKAHSVK